MGRLMFTIAANGASGKIVINFDKNETFGALKEKIAAELKKSPLKDFLIRLHGSK